MTGRAEEPPGDDPLRDALRDLVRKLERVERKLAEKVAIAEVEGDLVQVQKAWKKARAVSQRLERARPEEAPALRGSAAAAT